MLMSLRRNIVVMVAAALAPGVTSPAAQAPAFANALFAFQHSCPGRQRDVRVPWPSALDTAPSVWRVRRHFRETDGRRPLGRVSPWLHRAGVAN